MKKQKRTPWYPGDVKPVRVGWYERKWSHLPDSETVGEWWDGKQWRETPRGWVWFPDLQELPWRGLTREAK